MGVHVGNGGNDGLSVSVWFNNFTLRHFPKWISDAATAIHYYEALLATFSDPAVALLHGDFRPARLPDGYRLDQRQSPRR